MEDQTSSILGGYKDVHSMTPFLASVHEYFKGYPHYMCPVTICDEGEADFGFLLSEHDLGVERALEDIHYINGKAVQIGRILFVSGLPRDTTSDELGKFFSKFGEVEECEIASDKCMGGRPADFGLIVFKCCRIVDELAAKGRIHFGGNEVVVKKAKILNLSLSLDKVSLLKRFKDNLQCGDCCEAPGAPHVVCSVMDREKFPSLCPDSADKFTEDNDVDHAAGRPRKDFVVEWFVWPIRIPSPKSKLFKTKLLY